MDRRGVGVDSFLGFPIRLNGRKLIALISIIIPCYNSASTLATTIESALSQGHVDKEVIVIDDGSSDGSADVISSFRNAIASESGPNRGVSAARNRGTALARGDFIQYLDADDVLLPDTLAKRVEALKATGADIGYTDWQNFTTGDDGSPSIGETSIRSMESLAVDAQAACATSEFWAPPAAILYRKWVVDAVNGWRNQFPIIQDARFLFDAARTGARFTRVEGVGALYRVSSQSLSHRAPEIFIRDCIANAIDIQAIWKADGPLTEVRRKALIKIWEYLATSTFRNNQPEFREVVRRLQVVSGRSHLDMQMRMVLSSIAGKAAIWKAERRVRRMLRPVRQIVRRWRLEG
jgi:glycosyltransferase involved in cell wall biosynthesis